MKRLLAVLLVILCLCMTGCGAAAARAGYNSEKAILKNSDSYSKQMSARNSTQNGFVMKVSLFNGRETVWNKRMSGDDTVHVNLSMAVGEGHGKLVMVDSSDTITVLGECTDEQKLISNMEMDVPVSAGEVRVRLLGYDCRDLEINAEFSFGA